MTPWWPAPWMPALMSASVSASLLLAGLNVRFSAAQVTGAVTDACYQQLRSFKRTLTQQADADPAALFADQCAHYRECLEADKTAGALLPEEAAARTRTLALLEGVEQAPDRPEWRARPRRGRLTRCAVPSTVRCAAAREAVSVASDALESAFDFMEQAFPDGQEMVVFVNELALGPDSAPFLWPRTSANGLSSTKF